MTLVSFLGSAALGSVATVVAQKVYAWLKAKAVAVEGAIKAKL